MPKRKTKKDKYVAQDEVQAIVDIDRIKLAMKIPKIVNSLDKSIIKLHQEKPDWKLYRIEIRDNVPYIVREMCDRCGKVFIVPRWRKLRSYYDPDVGTVYLETGICKDCINASVYVDAYLDGDVLTEKEAKKLFYQYAEEYEKAWRFVIAAAPIIIMTEEEWNHRCKFFRGCAICGGSIDVRAKYFPTFLNGTHTPWNVIPLCSVCLKQHYAGRTNIDKPILRYRVFSTLTWFNKAKTIRMYLLHQMEKHGIYMEPLKPYRERFREERTLEGSD